MYRTKLPRVYQLKDLLRYPSFPNAYFQKFERALGISRQKMQTFVELEAELQQLDPASWNEIKRKAVPLLQVGDQRRGWHQLFETLNEVRGYIYLSRIGCREIRFIPPSKSKGIRSPDLQAVLGSVSVLCEVKTINISDREVDDRTSMTARDGADENQLSQEFLNKLRTVLIGARDQLLALSRADSRRIVYVVIKFDNFTGEFDAEYFSQIDAFINANRIPDVEIEFHKRGIKNT